MASRSNRALRSSGVSAAPSTAFRSSLIAADAIPRSVAPIPVQSGEAEQRLLGAACGWCCGEHVVLCLQGGCHLAQPARCPADSRRSIPRPQPSRPSSQLATVLETSPSVAGWLIGAGTRNEWSPPGMLRTAYRERLRGNAFGPPERVPLPLHHQRRHPGAQQLVQARLLRPARRVQRERQREAPTAPTCTAVRQATRAPAERPPTTSGPATSRRRRRTASQALSSVGGGRRPCGRRPATAVPPVRRSPPSGRSFARTTRSRAPMPPPAPCPRTSVITGSAAARDDGPGVATRCRDRLHGLVVHSGHDASRHARGGWEIVSAETLLGRSCTIEKTVGPRS